MVHALNEAWRVLVTQGIMVDVRPLSVNVPLEVMYEGGCEPAGIVDMSPDMDLDLAANRAINTVIECGKFTEATLEYFDFIYYWNTFHGMMVDFEERWKDEIIISKDMIHKAQALYKEKRPKVKFRFPRRMKLGSYEKVG